MNMMLRTVNPGTPISTIQTYADEGGSIYFEPGDYNWGTTGSIFVGRQGRDLEVIGIPHASGDRPKIIGGLNPFRCSDRVFMRIRNMEFFNPMGLAAILVTTSNGAEVRGCKFEVSGLHPVQGYRFGIWFIFRKDMTDATSSGSLAASENEFTVNGCSGAIGFGNFFNEPVPSFTAKGNVITVNECKAGVLCAHGNGTNAVFSNNTVKGRGIRMLMLWEQAQFLCSNAKVIGNDFSNATATECQVYVGQHVRNSEFKDNKIGKLELVAMSAPEPRPAAILPVTGIWCKGQENQFTDNDFTMSEIPGWLLAPYYTGCIYLDTSSSRNYVFESGHFPPGSGGAHHQCWDAGKDNRIVGLKANEMQSDPGIGQIIKSRVASASPGLQAEVSMETFA